MERRLGVFLARKILHELDLNPGEAIEFAKLNAGVVQPSRTGINPYYMGIQIYKDIEERWNNPTEEMKLQGVEPGSGHEKIFKVRELESDISFLRNYLTKDWLCGRICICSKTRPELQNCR